MATKKKTQTRVYNIKGRELAGRRKRRKASNSAPRRRRRTRRRGLAGLGSAKSSSMIMVFVFLVIFTGGGYLLWDWWKNKKSSDGSRLANDNAGAPAVPALPQAPSVPALPQSPAPSAVREVDNAFFAANPFAYIDGANTVNIRATPGENGQVIATAQNGQYVGRHTGKSTDIGWPTSPGTWAKITLTNGQIGWVYSGLLKSERVLRVSAPRVSMTVTPTGPAPITPAPVAQAVTPKTAVMANSFAPYARLPIGKLQVGRKYAILERHSSGFMRIAEGWVWRQAFDANDTATAAGWILLERPSTVLLKGATITYSEIVDLPGYDKFAKLPNGQFIPVSQIVDGATLKGVFA